MAVISLNGTGTPHQLALSWDVPVSPPVPTASYNIYRSTCDIFTYQLLHSAIGTQTAYMDQAVQAGATYNYIVTSVDSTDTERVPSNEVTVTIP
jgi:fibronectin type 3 domain-containing protein